MTISKKPSIDSIKKEQPSHSRKLHSGPNGTGPILEKLIVQNNGQIPQTTNQHYIKSTQNQLFAELEMRNLAKQKTGTTAFQKPGKK